MLPEVRTKRLPAVSAAMRCGARKAAPVPVALSALALTPVPASVVTAPAADTCRMRKLAESATKTLPL
jgi:hypothetical protein